MILRYPMTNPRDFDGKSVMLSKIDEFRTPKIRFSKNYRGQMAKKWKRDPKMGFCRNPATSDFRGRRRPFVPVWSHFRPFSYFFFSLAYFLWYFCIFFGMIFLQKFWWEAVQNEGRSLWFFKKAENFVAHGRRFVAEAKIGPNNVGVTWEPRRIFMSKK